MKIKGGNILKMVRKHLAALKKTSVLATGTKTLASFGNIIKVCCQNKGLFLFPYGSEHFVE